ncbi:hypothetical protein CPB83DRAFT_891534 [Crepidotus variabilis]|uniref:Uncharacterized protein n=1 Tax=Crepidotus variabilis TaxID=179855 RepID=A0A9P6EMK8_9AGAR|nr:hypothetical protein CPB83DRAFT_891534 [Crepidotus variabilis]
MKGSNKPPVKQPSAPMSGNSTTNQSKVNTSISALGNSPSMEPEEPPRIPASKVRLYIITMALLEGQVRDAAQHASECAEKERVAVVERLAADRQASLLLQKFYATRQAHEDEVAVYRQPRHLQSSNLTSDLYQKPSSDANRVERASRPASAPLTFSSSLTSIILEETATTTSQHSGNLTFSISTQDNLKNEDSKRSSKGKERAHMSSSIPHKHSAPAGPTSVYTPVIATVGPSVSPATALAASALLPPVIQTQKSTQDDVDSPPSTMGIRNPAERSTATLSERKECKTDTTPEELGHPLRTMDGASSPPTPIADPSNQQSLASVATRNHDEESNDPFDEFNWLLDNHLEHAFVNPSCLPGCACHRVFDKPFPSRPPSPV